MARLETRKDAGAGDAASFAEIRVAVYPPMHISRGYTDAEFSELSRRQGKLTESRNRMRKGGKEVGSEMPSPGNLSASDGYIEDMEDRIDPRIEQLAGPSTHSNGEFPRHPLPTSYFIKFYGMESPSIFSIRWTSGSSWGSAKQFVIYREQQTARKRWIK